MQHVSNNIIIGLRQRCRHCGQWIRIITICSRDYDRIIEDPADLDHSRLVIHNCPRRVNPHD